MLVYGLVLGDDNGVPYRLDRIGFVGIGWGYNPNRVTGAVPHPDNMGGPYNWRGPCDGCRINKAFWSRVGAGFDVAALITSLKIFNYEGDARVEGDISPNGPAVLGKEKGNGFTWPFSLSWVWDEGSEGKKNKSKSGQKGLKFAPQLYYEWGKTRPSEPDDIRCKPAPDWTRYFGHRSK